MPEESSGGSGFSPTFLTSAILGPVLVQQIISCGGLYSGAAWRKGEDLILVEFVKFVTSSVLKLGHLEKPTS